MSWHSPSQPQRRWCHFPLPFLPSLSPHIKHDALIIAAGVFFTLAIWIFVDLIIQSNIHSIPIRIEWAPGIALVLGMIIVNSLDQSRLSPDAYGTLDEDAWKVRLAFFIGVAVMVSACAGSVMITVFKYGNYGLDMWPGWMVMGECACLVMSSVMLWVAQGSEGEYHIALNTM